MRYKVKANDRKTYLEARSLWCLVDVVTENPERRFFVVQLATPSQREKLAALGAEISDDKVVGGPEKVRALHVVCFSEIEKCAFASCACPEEAAVFASEVAKKFASIANEEDFVVVFKMEGVDVRSSADYAKMLGSEEYRLKGECKSK